MIIETPYNQPAEVGYESVITDNDKPIAFRRENGELIWLFKNGLTSADIFQAMQDALHDLECSHGLIVHDGKSEESFTLTHDSLERLRYVLDYPIA